MSQEDAWNETTIKLSKATEVIFNYSNLTKLMPVFKNAFFTDNILMKNVRKYVKVDLDLFN